MSVEAERPDPNPFLVDFHVHATAYRQKDPAMTVEGILHRARELRLSAVGIVEHLAPSRGRPVTLLEHIRSEWERLGPLEGLHVFRGAEIDVTPEGTFEGPPDVRERLGLDYVIAAVHAASPGTPEGELLEDHLRRMLSVLDGPVSFEVMAHPWRSVLKQAARGRGQNPSFAVVPVAMQQELIKACAAGGVAIEVNAGSPLDDPAHDAFLRRALAADLKLATGSDAHYLRSLGGHTACIAALERVGAGRDDVWLPAAAGDTERKSTG